MAKPNNMDDDTIGTQPPPPEVGPSNDDTIAGDGEEVAMHDFANGQEEFLDSQYQGGVAKYPLQETQDGEDALFVPESLIREEPVPGHDSPNAADELQDNMTQDFEDHQEDVRQSVEEKFAVEPELPSQYGADNAMPEQYYEFQAHGDTPLDDTQYGQEQATEIQDQYDSQSLFVPERSPTPHLVSGQGSSTNIPPPARPLVAPRQATPALSTFAKIRNMQKMLQNQKNAANRRPTFQSNANPDNEAYLEAVMSGITPSSSTPVPYVDEDEMADRQAAAEYARQKRHYEDLRSRNGGKLSFRQDIEWMKINGAEQARKKKRQRDLLKAQEEDNDQLDLFPEVLQAENDENSDEAEDDAFNFDSAGPRKRRRQLLRKEPQQVSMQDAELHSMHVALDAANDRPRKKQRGDLANNASQEAGPSPARGRGPRPKTTKTSKGKAPVKKPTRGGRQTAKKKRELDFAVKQATSLFNSDVFQQQAGAGAPELPTFRSRVKADALKELIASVPIGDQKKAKTDMSMLMSATKEFDGRGAVKADGSGHWLVKGMKTSLKSYQVLGTAFMRRRENSHLEPKGGLMADQMGLGKTLMMLANIINGQPPKGAGGPRTTLLVASPALLTQWKSEIEQHTDRGLKIMRYGAGTRVDSNHAYNVLAAHDIVLTTYTEVMKSYPKNEPPIECQTAEQKMAWWKEVYENERGILHRMIFLRVVLDEAQAIKNHMARTSIACRALMAEHKWALSGTPILNSLTELYPYFKFLGVPHTGSFKIFKHNYCDAKDSENTERLLGRLAQFMIRRTHADELFGAPILKLPQADQTTYECEFNSVERCIYEVVSTRFAKRINMWAKKGTLEKSYSNALVMLLRLRQLTAHVLMLQFVMRDLLEREDIERIKQIVNEQIADCSTQRGRTIIAVRKQLDKLAADQKKKSAAEAAAKKAAREAGQDVNDIAIPVDEEGDNPDDAGEAHAEAEAQQFGGRGASGGKFGKEYNFKPFLSSLKTGNSWERAKEKAQCSYCGKQPRNPFMTSCGHLICGEPCLEEATEKAAEENKDHLACKTCGVTPSYVHPCDPEEEGDSPETVAQGTRAQSRKKHDRERKRRENEDIAEDWLNFAGDDVLPSAKTIAVKAQIINWTRENPGVKIIIYTQFLAMIRILARVCQKEGWLAEQYHGKMSFSARDKAISSFATNQDTKIMLASLRCGGLGLNLTMASKVIMIDPWWNSASEQQAFCRVFRIGQKEETFMSRLCVKNTVDDRLLQMQKRKQIEIESVMNDDGTKVKRMSLRDLMRLFGNLDEDTEGKPFIMVDNPDPSGGFRADRDEEGYADEL